MRKRGSPIQPQDAMDNKPHRSALRLSEERFRAANAALQAEVAKNEILLRESEVRLSALAGSTDEVVFEFDGNGKYLNVWTMNEALLFRPRNELIGRTLAEVFDEDWARHHVDRLRRVLASGTPEIYEWRIDLPSGRRWFLGRMNPMPSLDGARRTVCCLVRDITQRKHEQEGRDAQHGVARALADSDCLAAAAPHVLAAIGESMEWDWGAFWTIDRDQSRLCCEAHWHAPNFAAAGLDELGHEIPWGIGEGGPGRVCETAEPDWVANLPEDRGSSRREVAARAGLQSGIAVPIFDLRPPKSAYADRPPVVAPAFAPNTGTVEITGQTVCEPISGEVLGVIEFFSRELRERDEDQLAMLSMIGGQIGQFLKRKQVEAELRRREQELSARQEMLDLAQKAARAVAFDWYIGARANENRWSPDLEAMYGLNAGSFDRTYPGWKKLVHPDDWPSVKLAIERANKTGDIDAEYRVIHKDGTVHWLHAKGRMFFNTESVPERMIGFMIDVTDRREAEEELRAAETRFRTLVDHASDGFYLSDDQSRVIDVNEATCHMLGYSREELIGKHPRDFDVGLDEASIAPLTRRVLAGETVTFETLHRRRDGTVFPVEVRGRGFDQGGRRLLLALVRDITERKRAEDALREKDNALQMARTELARVSRLTTLGELTTSIAHEVSQPLGAMVASAGACARWLTAEPPDIAEARSTVEHIIADGKRAREVIARIRALTKRQAPRRDWLDVNHKISEVLALAEHELRSQDIVLRTDLQSNLPRVAGDRVQLQQVLLNLIMNALEAMSDVHDRPRELTIVSRQDGPDAVLVEVHDSGIGLDPQGAEKVFDAFFTTKSEGIGIGLSISRSIIEAHGGRLWVAPKKGPHGAVFRFSLPVVEEAIS